MQNKLLDSYYKMTYFVKGEPSTLQGMCNYELNGILIKIKKYPGGLLNGYDKSIYVLAVKYILKCRIHSKDTKLMNTESRYANRALDKGTKLTNDILKCMMITEARSRRKLVIH